jgi:hypothetical protein
MDTPEDGVKLFGPDFFLNQFREGFMKGSQAKLMGEVGLKLHGVSAKEMRFEHPNGRQTIFRSTLAGNRFYVWLASGTSEDVAAPQVSRFLNSFRLDGGTVAASARAGTAASASPGKGSGKSGWHDSRRQTGVFSVEAPRTLEYRKDALRWSGGSAAYHRFWTDAKGWSYQAGYADFPAPALTGGPQSLLDDVRNCLVEDLGGVLKTDAPVSHAGTPGSEFRIQMPDNRSALVRLYLVKNRIYHTAVTGATDQSYSDEALRFLDSFKLTK